MNKFTFTDLELLETIQKEYADDYLKSMNDAKLGLKNTRFYIPIDCKKIAQKMKVEEDIIFNRLYFHLNKKYSYKDEIDKNKIVYFFTFNELKDAKRCINYGYLCSVLADLKDNRKQEYITRAIAIVSILISIIALFH